MNLLYGFSFSNNLKGFKKYEINDIIMLIHATLARYFLYYRVKGLFDVGGGSYEGRSNH